MFLIYHHLFIFIYYVGSSFIGKRILNVHLTLGALV